MNRIQLRPTRRLGGFGLLLALLWLVSANYGNNLGYLLTYLLAGLGLAAPFHTRRQLAGLALRPAAPAPVFAGETAALPLRLDNPGPPRWQVRVSAPGAEAVTVAAADGTQAVTLPYRAERRGLLRIGPVTLSSTFPLGLFRAVRRFEIDWALWVYPRPAEQAPIPVGRSRAGFDGELEFQGLRDYRPGDSPRRIHWKGLAKGQGLLTREFVQRPHGDEHVFAWEALPPAETEQRLAWLCRLVLDAEESGKTYGLRLPGRFLPPRRGQAHLHACLQALAGFGGGGRG